MCLHCRDGKEETYSSFVKVRTQSISFMSQRLTKESALPTAKYLRKQKEIQQLLQNNNHFVQGECPRIQNGWAFNRRGTCTFNAQSLVFHINEGDNMDLRYTHLPTGSIAMQ